MINISTIQGKENLHEPVIRLNEKNMIKRFLFYRSKNLLFRWCSSRRRRRHREFLSQSKLREKSAKKAIFFGKKLPPNRNRLRPFRARAWRRRRRRKSRILRSSGMPTEQSTSAGQERVFPSRLLRVRWNRHGEDHSLELPVMCTPVVYRHAIMKMTIVEQRERERRGDEIRWISFFCLFFSKTRFPMATAMGMGADQLY